MLDEHANTFDPDAEFIPAPARSHGQHVENVAYVLERLTEAADVEAGYLDLTEGCFAVERFCRSELCLSAAERDTIMTALAALEPVALQRLRTTVPQKVVQEAFVGLIMLVQHWTDDEQTRAARLKDPYFEDYRDAVRALRHFSQAHGLSLYLDETRQDRDQARKAAA